MSSPGLLLPFDPQENDNPCLLLALQYHYVAVATGALVIFPLQSITDGNNTVIWCGIERQGLYSFAKSEWKMARSRKASKEETEK